MPVYHALQMAGKNYIWIEECSYDNCYKVYGCNLFVHRQPLQVTTMAGASLLVKAKFAKARTTLKFKSNAEQQAFVNVHNQYVGTGLTLYREMPGCHYRWQAMIDSGILQSQGDGKKPDFTMGSRGNTRWLPGAQLNLMNGGIACQCCDTITDQLSQTHTVPMGIRVRFDTSKARKTPVAYLNSGEIQVEGPLRYGTGYKIAALVTLDNTGIHVVNWPRGLAHRNLPPLRPYFANNVGDNTVNDWWTNHCEPWIQQMQAANFFVNDL